MPHSLSTPLRRLGAAAAFALLSCVGLPGLAQTAPGCAPGASGALPVVDTGLPVVQIWTTAGAPVLDRDNYVTACMRIRDGSAQRYGQGLFHGTIKIKGRGNSTWDMPKKGYRLKLDAAAQVLDMPAHKDWVLLANYADKTLLRNDVAMELSRRVGMPWTPRLRHAEVYLNDAFLGNYQLGEKIEVAPQRVAITPMVATDIALPPLSGGYLIEADFIEYIASDDRYFTTAEGINFVMQSPSGSSVQPAQADYIRQYTQMLETAILSGNNHPKYGYPAMIDLDSVVNWYLVQELTKNVDSPFGSSVYLQKDRNTLMRMGPLWDFDLAMGNADFEPLVVGPNGWYVRRQSAWIEALMRDKAFRSRVQTRWDQLKGQFQSIDAYIDAREKALKASQAENFRRWPILDTWVWPNSVVLGSHHAEVDHLRDWLKQRIKWMDKNVGK